MQSAMHCNQIRSSTPVVLCWASCDCQVIKLFSFLTATLTSVAIQIEEAEDL